MISLLLILTAHDNLIGLLVENIAYRMSACWHMRILVPSRSLQGDGNLYHK